MNGGSVVGRVIIGTDPHKRSATIEVRDEREILLATGRFGMDKIGYRQLLGYARQWPQRLWAVEGANGTGRPLAARLLAEGESVVDVPAKLAARVRIFDVGHGRKSDATDAHAIAMAALRSRGLRQLCDNEDLAVLRLLADRRDELSRTRGADAEPADPPRHPRPHLLPAQDRRGARPRWRPCAACAGASPMWSTASSSPTPRPCAPPPTRRIREGTRGRQQNLSSVADPTPTAGSSDTPQPGPAPATLPPTQPPASPAAAPRAGAPEASTWSAPPDERR